MTVENLEINISKTGSEAAKSFGALSKSVGTLKSSAEKGSTALEKLGASIKRIAFYRILRTALKEVTKAFGEGLKNAYSFSKIVGYELANTMDTLSTKSLTMKNQLGAALGGLIQAVEPILLKIISLATQAANALAALFGAFTTGQYLKAKDVATAWDSAAGAAGAYKRTILGFDEINRLDSPSGGGGGAANNFADMFEVTDIPQWAQKIRDVVSDIKFRINDVYGEWGNWDTQKIKETILKNLPTIAGCTIIGATIGGVKGALVGLTVGLALSFLRELYSADGEVDGQSILNKIEVSKVLPVFGALLGWKFGGLGGAAVGLTIGTAISLLFGREIDEISGSLDAQKILENMQHIVLPVAGALLGWKLGRFGGAAIGLVLGLVTSFMFSSSIDEMSGQLDLEGFLDKFMSMAFPIGGAILGWKITHTMSGAVIGLTIGMAVSLVANVAKSITSGKGFGGTPTEFTLGAGATGYASGGYPSRGDLFIAGEAGAEIVSSHGGQTQVSNTDQIAYSVQAGNGVVVDAIYAMANAIVNSVDRKDMNPVVQIGDRDVYRAWERGSNAVGGSLVHG